MEIALFWIIFAIGVGIAASARGRSGFGWFVVSCLLSPFLSVLLLIAMPKIERAPPVFDAPCPLTHIRCPDCRELVRKDARKCKHCGAALVPQS